MALTSTVAPKRASTLAVRSTYGRLGIRPRTSSTEGVPVAASAISSPLTS